MNNLLIIFCVCFVLVILARLIQVSIKAYDLEQENQKLKKRED